MVNKVVYYHYITTPHVRNTLELKTINLSAILTLTTHVTCDEPVIKLASNCAGSVVYFSARPIDVAVVSAAADTATNVQRSVYYRWHAIEFTYGYKG